MTKTPTEPTNLVLEQLRLIRTDMNERFGNLENEIKGLKTVIRGYGRQSIGEIYKANITIASFADFEKRLDAVERKVFL